MNLEYIMDISFVLKIFSVLINWRAGFFVNMRFCVYFLTVRHTGEQTAPIISNLKASFFSMDVTCLFYFWVKNKKNVKRISVWTLPVTFDNVLFRIKNYNFFLRLGTWRRKSETFIFDAVFLGGTKLLCKIGPFRGIFDHFCIEVWPLLKNGVFTFLYSSNFQFGNSLWSDARWTMRLFVWFSLSRWRRFS